MKEKIYQEIIIRTIPFVPELVSGIVTLLELSGIEERENELICYFEKFDDDDFNYLNNALENLKRESLIEKYDIRQSTLEHKNWNEEWEKTIQPIKVSDRIVIKPSFREYRKQNDEIIITIDPKMSFGTGYHQSTRIMLRLIEKYLRPNVKVLDVGTGTGILAIAAIKLGAKYAVTCDIDEFVEENVIENFDRNNVKDKCTFIFGTISSIKEKDFDLLFANIQKNVLLEIALEIKEHLRQNGLVILSGLLKDDQDAIVEKYQSLGFRLIEILAEDEWIGIVFEKVNIEI